MLGAYQDHTVFRLDFRLFSCVFSVFSLLNLSFSCSLGTVSTQRQSQKRFLAGHFFRALRRKSSTVTVLSCVPLSPCLSLRACMPHSLLPFAVFDVGSAGLPWPHISLIAGKSVTGRSSAAP